MKNRYVLLSLVVVLILSALALTGCNRERPAPTPARETPVPKVGPGTPTPSSPGTTPQVPAVTPGLTSAAPTPIQLQLSSPVPPTARPPATPAPQPPSAPAAAGSSGERIYTVVRGDTLNIIAQRFGVSAREIAQLNGITNPDRIYTGQKLRIPAPGASAGTQPQRTYIVRSGDTLAAIAARFGVTVEALVQANKLADADQIFVGQELKIP